MSTLINEGKDDSILGNSRKLLKEISDSPYNIKFKEIKDSISRQTNQMNSSSVQLLAMVAAVSTATVIHAGGDQVIQSSLA